MLAYDRRARWIRRMQDRAARRRDREWARRSGYWAGAVGVAPSADDGSRRAA